MFFPRKWRRGVGGYWLSTSHRLRIRSLCHNSERVKYFPVLSSSLSLPLKIKGERVGWRQRRRECLKCIVHISAYWYAHVPFFNFESSVEIFTSIAYWIAFPNKKVALSLTPSWCTQARHSSIEGRFPPPPPPPPLLHPTNKSFCHSRFTWPCKLKF